MILMKKSMEEKDNGEGEDRGRKRMERTKPKLSGGDRGRRENLKKMEEQEKERTRRKA